jgi:hypothetical protein
MDTTTAVILIVVALVIGAAVTFAVLRYRRTHHLRERFGPEYSRMMDETGSRSLAEERLRRREDRVHSYNIHPLAAEERSRFRSEWKKVQTDFVDDPKIAISEADSLLGEVMQARGYPVKDFDQQAADLSVDHPVVVQTYRAAHDVAIRHARGEADTEDLRRAMINYRDLFNELANDPGEARAAS